MLVREWMSPEPVTITNDTPIPTALRTMRDNEVRRLPVLDAEGNLVGIVSEHDLLYASPSPVTSLSVYEMHYLLNQLLVSELMTQELITVTPDTPLEEAARVMADNKIGGLPVLHDTALVGIITETDIFKVFLEMLGARQKGTRITVTHPERRGEIARITTAIAALGGNIVALGSVMTDDPDVSLITFKVEGAPADRLEQTMLDLGLEIQDIRDS